MIRLLNPLSFPVLVHELLLLALCLAKAALSNTFQVELMNRPYRSISLCVLLSLTALCFRPALADGTGQAQAPIHLSPSPVEPEAAKVVSLLFTRFHYRPQPLDQSFSKVVFDHLLENLDPERSSFTRADIDSFAPEANALAPSTLNGELSPAFFIVNRYLNRALEQYQYAQTLLPHGFDFTSKESVQIERKDAPWPSLTDELHDLWRKHAEDDWLRLKLAGQNDEAIRQTLTHRYQRVTERLKKTTPEDAFQIYMTAFSESMDPHTDYFVPKTALEFNTQMSLSLVGIGAYLREHDEYVQISELVPGGPAGTSGKVHVGDRIVAVGQGDKAGLVDVVGWRADDVVGLIRGAVGTSVRIELLSDERKGDSVTRTVVLQRRKVSIADEAARSSVIETADQGHRQRIGVISVPSFYEDFEGRRDGDPGYSSVSRDVKRMLTEFNEKHVDGVLIDLRNNGGGSLTEATALAGLFSGSGPVVQVRDARGNVEVDGAPNDQAVWTGPLGVLVNHGSASASEIFAAAIQDKKRGLIIGETTFGKGTVQNLVDLDSVVGRDGSNKLGELKMTIAQFYRVNGVSTQLVGVRPDISFPSTGQEKLFGESIYKNALPASSISALPRKAGAAQARFVSVLEETHEKRVADSPAWQLMLDEINAFQRASSRTSVSLNLAVRKADRDADIAVTKAFQDRRRNIDKAAGVPADSDDAAIADDGLDPSERALSPEKTPSSSKMLKDPGLQEAAQIVADESRLLIMFAAATG